jgi:hypothetical protein
LSILQAFFPSSRYSFFVAYAVAYFVYPMQTFFRYTTTFSMLAVAREQEPILQNIFRL